MITRYALFEGNVRKGQDAAFRAAVLSDLLPLWSAFPGAVAVRVAFSETRDEGAPEIPMILAVTYPDLAAVEMALASPVRAKSRAATEAVLSQFFDGRIHHHVMTSHDAAP